MSDESQPTIFERLGGEAGVSAAVRDLYDRILGDDELAPFFDGIDVEVVQRHQRELVTTAVGGPSLYTGRSLREAHEGLDVDRSHVDRVIDHLAASLASAGAAPNDVAIVVAEIERIWISQFWPA